ncbi:MAG: YlbF family regulator [Lachnospiraceae bacterium]|nr:YlbF family regulator [Lachnospiraceae bacterium]
MYTDDLEEALNDFLKVLRKTDEFTNYRARFAEIQDDEYAMGCVEKIRELNMQVMDLSEDEYERESENIAARMEELCSDSRVSSFILAEVDFSKLYQYITDSIVSALDE